MATGPCNTWTVPLIAFTSFRQISGPKPFPIPARLTRGKTLWRLAVGIGHRDLPRSWAFMGSTCSTLIFNNDNIQEKHSSKQTNKLKGHPTEALLCQKSSEGLGTRIGSHAGSRLQGELGWGEHRRTQDGISDFYGVRFIEKTHLV